MNAPVMEGMLWAGLLMLAVPLAIGLGVAIALWRRRRGGGTDGQAAVR